MQDSWLFCCFTSQVNSYGHGGMVSLPNHTFFLGKLEQADNQYFLCSCQQPFMNESAEGWRMTVEIRLWSISTKVWDRAGVELATPWSAVRHASVARLVTDWATWPSWCKIMSPRLVEEKIYAFFEIPKFRYNETSLECNAGWTYTRNLCKTATLKMTKN